METGPFQPHPLLRSPHAQTLFPYLLLRIPAPPGTRERVELEDGDFLDLCHFGTGNRARVCLFHGLEGSARSHYVGGLIRALVDRELHVTFMHFRGCSGEPNRLPRAYHSGDTGDMAHVIDLLHRREPDRPLAAVGFSLGGNALLKYLGETGGKSRLAAAVGVSVPFDLDACATRIDQGFSRLYQHHLVRQMKRSTRARRKRVGELPIDWHAMESARTFREFDEHVTAPLHGFDGATDYYARASSRPWLGRIATPTRLIQALDDPFVGPGPVPDHQELAEPVLLDASAHGGHVGFVSAGPGQRPQRWLDQRIPQWLDDRLP